MRKVLVFGTFDGLHPGHYNFFKQAKKYGDYLIVVVARDIVVKKIKKHFPIKNEQQRLKEIQKYESVNKALLGYKKNPYLLIKKINPDVICLGYDQKAFTEDLAERVKEVGLKIKIYRLKPYKPTKYHSSIISKVRIINNKNE